MSAVMANPKKGDKRKPGGSTGSGEMNSTRLFAEDVSKLAELSALRRDKSIAVTFHTVFGPMLDSALIAAAEERAAQLRRGQE